MDKVRITDVAKELGMNNKDILEKAKDIGLDVKGHASSISAEDAEKLANYILTGEGAQTTKSAAPIKPVEEKKPEKKEIPVETPKAVETVPQPKTKTLKEKERELGIAPASVMPKELSNEGKTDVVSEDDEGEEKVDPTNVRKRRGLVIVKKKTSRDEANRSRRRR